MDNDRRNKWCMLYGKLYQNIQGSMLATYNEQILLYIIV